MLRQLVDRYSKDFTTITTFLVVLEEYLKSMEEGRRYVGLTPAEINLRYSVYKVRFNQKKEFYSSYVVRHAKNADFFIENERRYSIRPELLEAFDIQGLKNLRNEIILKIQEDIVSYDALFDQIKLVMERNDSESSLDFIHRILDNREFDFKNYGQIFEVAAYSILKSYFRTFGFVLNRFSTSFSNDGGMDYISALGIYQVTATPTLSKIESDLTKLPGIKRVLVLSNCTEKVLEKYLAYADVTEILSLEDLKNHFLAWLYKRDTVRPVYLKEVLTTIKDELIREQ